MTDIYCIGELLVDFVPGSETDSYIKNAGGAPANVAIAASRSGLSASMCCKVGDDDFGRYLTGVLKDNGVSLSCGSPCPDAVTTMAFVTLGPDGERSFTFARKPGADMFLKESDVSEEDIEKAAIIHGGSFSLSAEPAALATRKALSLGRRLGKLVSFDVNYRNLVWQDRKEDCKKAVRYILDDVDLLKISEEELDIVGGRENLFSLMDEKKVTAVVLTLGSEGSECFFNGEVMEKQAGKVKAIDTTGAGDAFWGGFLTSLIDQGVRKAKDLNDIILQNALDYGNACGELCVQKKGAIPAIPTREEIERYIEM